MAKLLAILVVACLTVAAQAISKLEIPQLVTEGEDLKIDCTIDTRGGDVKWVKWLKDDQEILILEKGKPPVTRDVEGVVLDLEECSMNKLVLKRVTTKTTGMYMCELKLTENGPITDLIRLRGNVIVLRK